MRPAVTGRGATGILARMAPNLPPELADLAGGQPAAGPIPGASLARRLLLSWAPAAVAPALWAFGVMPGRLTWTGEVASHLFSLLSPVYDEVTTTEGYGESLELAMLDLRGAPQRILDVATGTGFAALQMKRRYPDTEVIGVDIARQMVQVAAHNATVEKLDVTFQVADAAKLPFEDASFDLVVCMNAPPYCDELLRLLKPRGRALVVFSFGGPWVELAWSTLAERFLGSGASQAKGRRGGLGFYGIARKRAV